MRKNHAFADIDPTIPVGSDCGSLYPNPGYSQANINMALSDKLDRIEKENRFKLDRIEKENRDELTKIKEENRELKDLMKQLMTKLTLDTEQRKMADARYDVHQSSYAMQAIENSNNRECQY